MAPIGNPIGANFPWLFPDLLQNIKRLKVMFDPIIFKGFWVLFVCKHKRIVRISITVHDHE